MKNKELKITISGCAASGKSTLSAVISKHLAELGYNIAVLPTDDNKPKKTDEYITHIAPITDVVIEEVRTVREPIKVETYES